MFMDLVLLPRSYFSYSFAVSSVVQLLFLLLFVSESCHVRENGFLLERVTAVRVHVFFFSEKLVHKKRGFVG